MAEGRRITVATESDVVALERDMRAAAASAARGLADLLIREEPLAVLGALKFAQVGFDPLQPARPHYLLEQVHQTFAYLTAVRGLEYLLGRHPAYAPFHLNLGTSTVPDLESADGDVIAEVFAGISVLDNRKVESDLARLRASAATFRYLFYYAAERSPLSDPEIEIIAVDL